jgi:hypothetical protein
LVGGTGVLVGSDGAVAVGCGGGVSVGGGSGVLVGGWTVGRGVDDGRGAVAVGKMGGVDVGAAVGGTITVGAVVGCPGIVGCGRTGVEGGTFVLVAEGCGVAVTTGIVGEADGRAVGGTPGTVAGGK